VARVLVIDDDPSLLRALRIGLSARGYDRVRRIARTVADLGGGAEHIELLHVREALLLRSQRNLLLGEDLDPRR